MALNETQWPARKIERRLVSKLAPAARNAKLHSPEQVGQIAASIQEWGWTMPVLIDEHAGIIAGHGRVLAAQSLGLERVPCVVARGWTEAQKRAYCIADNRLSEAPWDQELLRLELGELQELEGDLSLLGFSDAELSGILNPGSGRFAGEGPGSLSAQFGIPPFSVFNAREGWWQERKRAWLSLGIQSELGRGGQAGTSAIAAEGADASYREIGGKSKRKPRHKANAAPSGRPMPKDRPERAKYRQPRKANATPGGAPMPAADYGKSKARGDGRWRPLPHTAK